MAFTISPYAGETASSAAMFAAVASPSSASSSSGGARGAAQPSTASAPPSDGGGDDYLALTAVFGTVSAVAVTPDGVLHVADQGNAKIRSVTSSLPPATLMNEFVLFSPDVHEAYVFNRYEYISKYERVSIRFHHFTS